MGGLLSTPPRRGPVTVADHVVFAAHLTDTAVDGLPTAGVSGGHRPTVRLPHQPTGTAQDRVVDWVVVATHAVPADELWHRLKGGAAPVHRIGDCLAPRRAHAATVEGERVGAAR